MSLPVNIINVIERARKEDIYELVRLGLVPSAEVRFVEPRRRGSANSDTQQVLANLIPEVSVQTRSATFEDKELRQLYAMLYLAFKQRRSLLLVVMTGQTVRSLPFSLIRYLTSISCFKIPTSRIAHVA